ncbi:type IV secretion system protein TraC [Acerihabitans sp. TG2]|uniref:type IV secretion system protein TraC n=1 Tax=Acerihabitans sp. TG2 TaxID=3096008 RepID=UPI002B233970|nr:type IV secretion system protein TraC [Acerihabitans sp. TG2]MEA9392695.1 type IV secretion system protein TraC [Acerihabitans sp. TG2]
MSDTWLDQLMNIVAGSKDEGGAKSAGDLLQQSLSYPSITSLLPYRMYDEKTELFINSRSIGFIIEVAPLAGANQEVVQALDDLLRKKMPRKTPITVLMVASKCVGEMLDHGLSKAMWKGDMAPRLNAITKAYWERAALKGLSNEREYPLYLRDYRVFLVYARTGRGGIRAMDSVAQLRETLRVSLMAAHMETRRVGVSEFLSVMREQLNYRPGQVTRSADHWNPDQELHRQCVDHSTEMEVRPGYLRVTTARQPEDRLLGKGRDDAVASTRIVNMQLTKTPTQFALWQASDNLQNMRFPDLGIPCPFIISWTVSVEEQVKSQNDAFKKEQDLGKKAATSYAKLFPGTQRAYEEWRDLRQGLASNEIAMCNFTLNLTLFTPDDPSEQQSCELAAINVFRKNDLEISAPRFQQLRNWISTFPFMMQEGLWEDMVQMGATMRCKSFNAVNLMPVVAERQMSPVGSPLPTYRNQLAFFDMFSESNGSTNFNIAVTGTTGAGKSFFIQEILRQVLNAGGFAWVIDMGASYKNFCKQAGGVYLDGATLRFNPFANVLDIKESAEGITGLLTVLASPDDKLDKVSENILMKGVVAAWGAKNNKARIDDVVGYMTSEEVKNAYGEQPTIMSRINELVLLLDRWCTWGANGEYFNSDSPTLDGETRFAVLELLSLEKQPHLLSAILYSLILAIQEKMYHSPRDLKKVAIVDEAWRLFSGSNPHAARFIETGYRTVRRHRGAFITITQGIKDFTGTKDQAAPPAAAAAWDCSGTKVTLLQDSKAFKTYLNANPDQFSELETQVIRGFQPAKDTGFSSVMISTGENSSFHRVFVDPVTRAMFSTRGEDFQYMSEAQIAGATSEEAAYLLASEPHMYQTEMRELELWAGLRANDTKEILP